MDVETTKAKMMAQVDQARQSAMVLALGWQFEIDELTVHVALSRRKEPGRANLLRVRFDEFPKRCPSYGFVDPETKQETPDAWPPGVMHSPYKICTPGTREFHEDLHKNDAQYRWDADKYTFLSTLRMIHRLMEAAN